MRNFLTLAALAIGLSGAGNAIAHGDGHWHGHARGHVGVFIGAPLYAPYYRPPVVYGYSPVITVPPPVYIEQQDSAQAAPGWWYYCRSAQAYYPYVSQCPEPWERVAPYPPAPRTAP